MSFPPPPPSSQSSIASSSDKASTARSARSQQTAWGPPGQQQGSRRGLTPLTTSNVSAIGSGIRRSTASSSPGPQTSSNNPLPTPFSAVLSSSNRLVGSRNNSSGSQSASSYTPLQAGFNQGQYYQSNQNIPNRSRTNTPGSASHLASSHLSLNTSQGGGGGAGGGGGTTGTSRTATYSPALSSNIGSPTAFTFDRSAIAQPSTASTSSGSSLSKISIAQVLLLVDTINEKEGKAKWDSKADQIRKLVESNGMDVFSKYFRRLVSGNAAQIFPGTKNDGNTGNYQLLVDEMHKVMRDPAQAQKIVETIDTADGDIFRDFDLATFIRHFRQDPIADAVLALAFTSSARQDLRYKGTVYFGQIVPRFLESIASPRDSNRDLSPSVIAQFLETLAPNHNLGEDFRVRIDAAVRQRYERLRSEVPSEILSGLSMLQITSEATALMRQLQKAGPRGTSSVQAANELLDALDVKFISPEEVSNALLFLAFSPNARLYNPSTLVDAVRAQDPALDWRAVIEGFDIRGLPPTGVHIESSQLAILVNALLPVCRDDDTVDVQLLWGGRWTNPNTQLSFLKAFLFSTPNEIDISTIPRFRSGFSMDIFQNAPENIQEKAAQASKSTFNSLDAVTAVFDLLSESNAAEVKEILERDLATFLVSASRIPGEWNAMQHALMTMSFNFYLMKMNAAYDLALYGAWRQNQIWVLNCLVDAFSQDPMQTEPILDLAQELGWIDELLTLNSPFALDLACLLHKRDSIDFDEWLRKFAERQPDIGTFLIKYLRIKADDESRVQRREQPAPRSVSLAVKTVFSLLLTAEDYVTDEDLLVREQRTCLATYPRLVNYGEGYDEIIEANGAKGNSLPEDTDKQMQDLFGKMYREEAPIREILELMRRYKTSRDSTEQDLFTCIVHGLFDEYHCYHEYPAEALMKTAVMFGGIINFKLISGIPMKVGLGLILDAVRQHEPSESMFKFGVEAIEQLTNRLPEWPAFCHVLAQIPTLAGTSIAQRAEEILREQGHDGSAEVTTNGVNGHLRGEGPFANGEIPTTNMVRSFRSLHIDHPQLGRYADPPEDVQDKVLFALNNMSKDNFEEKLSDIRASLTEEHYQWFAGYLVESRVKLEPNYQSMYLEALDVIGSKQLFDEVLRETFVSSFRMINAESTITSSPERALLRNLGGWLGLLTIARDRPIKHKNIYFKELLVEGWQSQRLIVVLPFTCRVLLQAMHSKVFMPPNPWLMDIIGVLLELYGRDIKLNLKFEIEVLCKDLKLDMRSLKPSTCIQDFEEQALQAEDDLVQAATLPEFSDLGDDLGINGIARTLRSERLSPAALMSNLPDLESILTYPSVSNVVDQALVRNVVFHAFQRAISEIIGPVVERSITIASIATAQSVAKDFSMESDEDKLRTSARQMVKSLAGSLALVTCKEPLRMSITNYIRRPPEQTDSENFLPEGIIMICLNDNLDKACSYIEKAAEEKSVSEIDRHIDGQVEARRRHKAANPNAPFVDPSHFNRWSTFIPEPFRQIPGGLNEQQLAVYKDFAPQARGTGPNHVPNSSTDSTGRQMPDVLQEPFTTMPNLSTPAEQPAMPLQAPLSQQEPGRMQPSLAAGAQPQMNGYMDSTNPQEKIQSLLAEMSNACKTAGVEHVKDLPRESSIFSGFHKLLQLLTTSTRPNGEVLARFIAEKICTSIFAVVESQLEIEIMAHLLAKICSLSDLVSRDVFRWMASQEENHIFNIPVTIALIDAGLVEYSRIDFILTKSIVQRKPQALQLLSDLMDHVLFCEEPSALRADFSSALDAMNVWLGEDPDLSAAAEINNKLRATGVPETVKQLLSDEARAKQDQMEYIFSEWIALYQNPAANERMYATFMKDLHQKQTINNQEDSAMFLRLCIDKCVSAFEQEAQNPLGNLSDAYLDTDAFAKLIILLIKVQGESNGSVKSKKAAYLKSMMSLIVLVENHHQVMRGEGFNQRVFYRLFSSIFCEYTINGLHRTNEHANMMTVFAETLLATQPLYIPGFAYGWLSLISHRVFMPGLLNIADEAGWELYAQIMQAMLRYICEQLKPMQISLVSQDLYRGCLRILLILHHDFPEFVAENHFRLASSIPAHCTQLRNLILSAYPSSLQELPDPFTGGLKVDRLAEMTKSPRVAGNFVAPLEQANLKVVVDNVLRGQGNIDEAVTEISDILSSPKSRDTGLLFEPLCVDPVLLNALVIYIAEDGINNTANKTVKKTEGGVFDKTSPHATLFEKLCKVMDAEGRYHFINAIANQLRYPNSHTHYFSYVVLQLFGMDHVDQQDTEIRQLIVRVILERLIVHRPHPWGLLIVLLELDHNTSYRFWDLPFIAAAPEIKRLFHSLSSHIHQPSPHPLT